MSRPRLAVLTTTFPLNEVDASPSFVFELCVRLADAFELTVITPDTPGARSGDWDGIQVHRYRYAPKGWQQLTGAGGILGKLKTRPWLLLLVPLLLAAQAITVRRWSRKVDLWHAHWLFPQGLIAVLAGGGKPVLCTSHGADVFALRGRGWDVVRRFVMRRAAAVTVVGPTLRQALLPSVAATPLHCLPMGVDLAGRFRPDPRCSPTPGQLLFVGRLVPKKGADLAIKALARLPPRHPALRLQIIGEGSMRDELRALAASLGIADRVEFVGAVPNPQLPSRYQQADVVLLPFREADDGDAEGLGLTLVEALACGCKLVVGRVAAQELLSRNMDGLWAAEAGDVSALAERIVQALDSPPDSVALRAQREAGLADYDWSRVATAYRELLRSLLPS